MEVIGQRENLLVNRVVEPVWITLLKIRSSTAAHEQGVPREDPTGRMHLQNLYNYFKFARILHCERSSL